MMATWAEQAEQIIRAVDATLPTNASVKERAKAYREAMPYHFRGTSWGKKSWSKARRKVLAQYGPKADTQVPVEHLSPLERMMARAER